MSQPQHPDADHYDSPRERSRQAGPAEHAEWADLADLGVPNVEPEEDRRQGRGIRTAVALVAAAAVVAGGIALVSPGISKALENKPATTAPSSATATLTDEEEGTDRPSPTPTTASPRTTRPTTEPTPSGTDISRLADAAWVSRVAAQAGIPERALASYAGASIRVQELRPGCRLGWNTLAAIGKVESAHGSINGNTLSADGTVSPGVYGVALDGSGRVAAIQDTDQGKLDGDPKWDRAVGPMQFIPSTWEKVKQDGNADGVADVQQLDDATLTAGIHLCDVGGDLSVSQNWIKAIGAYNPSLQYNNDVARIATTYAGIS